MKLDRFAFPLMGLIIVLLITASVLEKIISTEWVVRYIYTAPWTIALWAITIICALYYIFKRKIWHQPFTFLLHFAFVIILTGAMTTHLFGKEGKINLRIGEQPTSKYELKNGINYSRSELPFLLQLTDFTIEYYPGTHAPMDFVSHIEIYDNSSTPTHGQISMNNILKYHNYRFYQSSYDSDGMGSTFSISYDPWGIGITYFGYLTLLISMIGFFLQRKSHFRQLIKSLGIATLILLPTTIQAANAPQTITRSTAEEFGNLYVYYNDRVCPMQTLAKDFTTKLYGKPTYQGLSAEQVLCGWLFYYDKWASEPCIKIKGKEVRTILGIKGKYACLNDFVGNGKYKLETLIRNGDKNALAADEKFQLISMVCTARMLKIYPISQSSTSDSQPTWYSWSEQLPSYATTEDWQFVHRSMDYVSLCIARNANTDAQDALQKIRTWQETHSSTIHRPTPSHFKAEKMYNSLNYTRPVAMICSTLGIILFVIFILLISKNNTPNKWLVIISITILVALFGILSFALILRWVISGHIPLTSGFETMQFMAWAAALITIIISIKQAITSKDKTHLTLPFGLLICGMTLMVSMMSASNPQITNLMPVLQSPLLTIHVAIIMIAYVLLAFTMLNGIAALIISAINHSDESAIRLQQLSLILLYPAVFCLTIGIFIGAVWANISWGRYWGWDPKEVWALITMMIYSFPLHSTSLNIFKRTRFFHIYMIFAFLSVLFTYFGVNFILGGLHSYA